MKKLLYFTMIMMLLLLFVACSEPQEQVDTLAFADRLSSEIAYTDAMFEVDDDTISAKFGVDLSSVDSKKVYMSTGATAEEIAVFKAKDKESAQEIYTLLEERIEFQKADFLDYNPNEMEKLNDFVLEQKDIYVIMCVSNDSKTARELIEEEF